MEEDRENGVERVVYVALLLCRGYVFCGDIGVMYVVCVYVGRSTANFRYIQC
jgi:hypothetical protein